MKLHFSINYHTNWGECVKVSLRMKNLKGQYTQQYLPLETANGEQWSGEVLISQKDIIQFEYFYCIFRDQVMYRKEWDIVPRRFDANVGRDYIFPDHWRDVPLQAYLYSSAFYKCIQPHQTDSLSLPYFESTLILRVQAPQLLEGEALALLGNQPALGDWNPNFALQMTETDLYEWSISLSANGLTFPFEYKYVVVDKATGSLKRWEGGGNRLSSFKGVERKQVLVQTDQPVKLSEERWKGAGVVIPLFSIRTDQSAGVGDFGDLKKMVDWVDLTGMRVIQLLPIYDTTMSHTWWDSYPYNGISVYALHPQYVDLRQLPELRDATLMESLQHEAARLNRLASVDYEAVNALKWKYLKAAYEQEGRSVLASDAYRRFYDENSEWLVPYAAFSFLREKYQTANFHDWPEYSVYHVEEIRSFCSLSSSVYTEIAFYFYVQFQLYTQLAAVAQYARQKRIILKGDIPIGISRCSVEAWVEPFYFNMNGQAGAPPDDFSEKGQNWGFPTYNWEAIFKDNFSWWTRRLGKMAEFFDAYRIDHVLGFFRIWEIPMHSVYGLLGQFVPALPLSVEEIEAAGLHFRVDPFTKPYITEDILDHYFAELKSLVKEEFLNAKGYDWYELKPEFDTQRKVQGYFEQHDYGNDTETLREGLYALISDVLFVPDRDHPEMYHPRIAVQKDFVYQMLSASEREAFDRIYIDYYYHRHNHFWYGEAMRKLPAIIDATRMLVCAEDLGMVPECVGWALNDLRILTLEIQSMPKNPCYRFGHLEENPYRSVATIFTHDMPTMRLWWEEDAERRDAFYHDILQKDGPAPEVMPGWLCEEVVARHLYSPSMLCLISWQDWMAMDEQLRNPDAVCERINVPANPHNNWNYRMHLSVEQLMTCEEQNNRIRQLIQRSGRNR